MKAIIVSMLLLTMYGNREKCKELTFRNREVLSDNRTETIQVNLIESESKPVIMLPHSNFYNDREIAKNKSGFIFTVFMLMGTGLIIIRGYKRDTAEVKKQLLAVGYMQSHELRAPVARILGLANLFENHCKDDDSRNKLVHLIRSEVEDLDMVVFDIVKICERSENAASPGNRPAFITQKKGPRPFPTGAFTQKKNVVKCKEFFEKKPGRELYRSYRPSLPVN